MTGVLKAVNGELVQVDSKWYKAQKPQFVPKELNANVSFSVSKEDPTVITYIKVVPAAGAVPAAAAAAPAVKKESAPSSYGTKKEYKTSAYGSPEDNAGKEVGCAIGAASQILSGAQGTTDEILVKFKTLVAGILKVSREEKKAALG